MDYDDIYTGVRWRYGLQYRPVSFGNVPKGWLVWSDREHPDYLHGTVDYPFEIPTATAEQMDMVPLGAVA